VNQQPAPADPTSALLRKAYNALAAGIYQAVVHAGGKDLRPAHGNVLEMLAIEDGLRLTDIAALAGMATQSMGELVDDLVRKEYIERRVDPADRRAKRIHLTAKGRAHADSSWVAVGQAESELVALLGAQRYEQLRTDLIAVAGLRLELRA
jgi:MarR family transcriptional regulator, temperature-dependent positive regulator of motility